MVKNKYRDDKKGPNSVATVLFPDLLYQMHFELNIFGDDFHVFLLNIEFGILLILILQFYRNIPPF